MNEEKIIINLYDGDGNEVPYQAERMFQLEDSDQCILAASPVTGGELVFLYCNITESEDSAEISVSDIPSDEEYNRTALFYQSLIMDEQLEKADEELHNYDDYITLTDEDGNKTDFLIHVIFDDETAKRSYVAMQKINPDRTLVEEIVLYRFKETNDGSEIEMIPSDMEYERVRSLFLSLLDE